MFKKAFAIFLAFATFISATGINKGMFAEVGQGQEYLLSGNNGEIRQIFKSTATKGGKAILKSVSIPRVKANPDVTAVRVRYTISFNSNPTNPSSLSTASSNSNARSISSNNDVTATYSNGTLTVPIQKDVQLAFGEYYTVTINNISGQNLGVTTSGDNYSDGGYINSQSVAGKVMNSTEEVKGELPNDVTGITLSTEGGRTAISSNETLKLITRLNPEVNGRKREITYNSSNDCITVGEDGSIQPKKEGASKVTASYNGNTGEIWIYVISASISEGKNQFEYTGNPIEPDLKVQSDSELSKVTDDSKDGYRVVISDNTDVGDKKLNVIGTGKYKTFRKDIDFKITQKEIKDTDVNNEKTKVSVSSSGDVTVEGLSVDGKALTQNIDFIAKSSDPSVDSEGTSYKVIIQGQGNYKGTVEKKDKVKSVYGNDNKIDLKSVFTAKLDDKADLTYTGKEIKPAIKLFYTGSVDPIDAKVQEELLKNQIGVTYDRNINAGDAKVTLKSTGDRYKGTIDVPFEIKKRDIKEALKKSSMTIEGISYQRKTDETYDINSKYVYTGHPIEFKDLSVKMNYGDDRGKFPLTSKTDYDISYKNNKEISTAPCMILEGKGNYSGLVTFNFEIIPDILKDLKVSIGDKEYSPKPQTINTASSDVETEYEVSYDGTEKRDIPVKLYLDKHELVEGTDFTKECKNKIVGNATLTIIGQGNYADKKVNISFKIVPKKVKNGRVEVKGDHIYNWGEPVVPSSNEIEVFDGNKKLNENDYRVECSDNKNATKKAKIKIIGKGNYEGTIEGTYEIKPFDITSMNVNPSNAQENEVYLKYDTAYQYTGNSISPNISVFKGNKEIVSNKKLNKDLTLTCTNNKNKNAKVNFKVEGKNNLQGSKEGSFAITNRGFDNLAITIDGHAAKKDPNQGDSTKSVLYIADDYKITYSKFIPQPNVVIKDINNNTILKSGRDYNAFVTDGSASSDLKKAELFIKGLNTYDGSNANVQFVIEKKDIKSPDISIKNIGFKKNKGKETYTPAFSVKDGLNELEEGKDYIVICTDKEGVKKGDGSKFDKNPGIHYVKIAGINNYTGFSDVISYERGTSLEKVSVKLVNPKNNDIVYGSSEDSNVIEVPYIGEAHPKFIVTLEKEDGSSVTLKEGKSEDYVISYDKDNVYDAGNTIIATIKPKEKSADYYSEKKISYKIVPVSFVTKDNVREVYDDNDVPKDIIDKDYFTGNIGAVVVSDNENSKTGAKRRADLSARFAYYFANQGGEGGYDALEPNAGLKYYATGGSDPITLKVDKDYEYEVKTIDVNSYTEGEATAQSGNKDKAKVVVVRVKGKGNFTDTFDIRYIINDCDLSDNKGTTNNVKVSSYDKYFTKGKENGVLEKTYDGLDVDLAKVKLLMYGATLRKDTDYTIDMASIKFKAKEDDAETSATKINDPGIYTVTFKGTGTHYINSKTVTIKINAKNLDENKVQGKAVLKYTGNKITSHYTLMNGKKPLNKKYYDISIYKGNIVDPANTPADTDTSEIKDIGIYTVVFKGKDKYRGFIVKKIKVVGDISEDRFTITGDFTGSYSEDNFNKAINGIVIKYNNNGEDKTLENNKDYKITYFESWKGPGSRDVTLTGISEDKVGSDTVKDDGLFVGEKVIKNNMTSNIKDADITDNQTTAGDVYPYTGEKIKPDIVVRLYGQTLKVDKDYKINYTDAGIKDAPSQVGKYEYTIKGIGKYDGQIEEKRVYYIKYNLADAVVGFTKDNIPSGKYKQSVTEDFVKNRAETFVQIRLPGGSMKKLIENTDYIADYDPLVKGGPVKVGMVTVTIKPNEKGENKDRSFNSKIATYELVGQPLKGHLHVTINGKKPEEYSTDFTGYPILDVPDLKVEYGNGSNKKILKEGDDYTISYGKNTDAGNSKGEITITGINMYSGKVTEHFGINKVKLTGTGSTLNQVLSLDMENPEYGGMEYKAIPKVSFKMNNYELQQGRDYDIEVTTPKTKGDGTLVETVTFTGKKNFTGTYKQDVVVNDRDIGSGSVTIQDAKEYDGKPVDAGDIKLTVDLGYKDQDGKPVRATLMRSGNTGKKGDYTVTPVSELSPNVGSYSFTITAVEGSHYTGQITKTIEIKPKNIKSKEVEINLQNLEHDYTGQEVKPTDIVAMYKTLAKKDGHQLDPIKMNIDKDYKVSYKNNINSASKDDKENAPTIVIEGTGNYTGSKNITFNIGKDLGKVAEVVGFNDPNVTYDGFPHGEDELSYDIALADDHSVELSKESDYTVKSVIDTGAEDVHKGKEDIIHAGTKTVTLKGIGQYYGALNFEYHIKKKNPIKNGKWCIRVKFKKFKYNEDTKEYETIYNGRPATSDVELYDDDIDPNTPISSDNYELYKRKGYAKNGGYINNETVSNDETKAGIAIMMKGDYDTGGDTLKKDFNILGKPMKFDVILLDADNVKKDSNADRYPYDYEHRRPIVPRLAFRDGSNELKLVRGKDYTVTINNNKTIGTATMIIKGMGNYSGTVKKTFDIYADLEHAKVNLNQKEYYYLGLNQPPHPSKEEKIKSIEVGGITLDKNDYTVTETSDNDFQTSGKLVIMVNPESKRSNYLSKTASKEYKISTELGKYKIKDKNKETGMDFPDYEYTGKEIKPDFTVVQPDGTELKINPDAVKIYKITPPDKKEEIHSLVDAGHYRVEIPLFKTATGEKVVKANFNVGGIKIRERDVTFIRKYTYDGYAKKPYLSVRRGRKTLQEGKDYKLKYENYEGEETEIKNCGEYYPVIEGLGEYKNTLLKFRLLEKPRCIEVVPTAVNNLNLSKINSGLKYLNWNTIDKIDGVKIKVKEKGKTGFKEYTTANTSYMLSGLEGGKTYEIQVIPYIYDKERRVYYFGDESTLIETLDIQKPDNTRFNSSKLGKTNTLEWKSDDSSISGYDIFRSTSYSGQYRRVAIVPVIYGKYKDNRTKKGRIYYYKIRTYKVLSEDDFVFSPFGDPIKVKVN